MQGGHGTAGGREVDFRDQARRLSLHCGEARKRGHLFSRNEKVLNKRFLGVVETLASLRGTSFSTENLSPKNDAIGLKKNFP